MPRITRKILRMEPKTGVKKYSRCPIDKAKNSRYNNGVMRTIERKEQKMKVAYVNADGFYDIFENGKSVGLVQREKDLERIGAILPRYSKKSVYWQEPFKGYYRPFAEGGGRKG